MKKLLMGSIIAFLFSFLSGCESNKLLTDNVQAMEDKEGFIDPEPSDWARYIKPVREYMYHRTQAVINNDIDILWKKYPDLKDHIDFKQGVNVEKYEVESLNESFDLLDANYNVESYEQIKVKTINDQEVIVLFHGSIVYVRNDFDESGGEHLIKVFLEQKGNHWTVVKTDEYTLPEYKEWFEENKKQ
ncbi:hypothetical protein [Pseudogracilibacillus auburnensis]|uniref:hypothetical protein n=1 Tax=Pseudogracilibacillus auburnensis TaxID=1494959 RepID=UPI001A957F81|nr:hypothetical protein [Pseudogracilibacillus auburnensis]MBO1003989.1 hypothetical protein [Pseudogracilibacillus auburnensis]